MPIAVEGLEEARRALRAINKELEKALRHGLNDVAEIVGAETRSRVPRRTGRLAQSVKAASTARQGRVKMGSPKRVPYAGWIEFGGTIRHSGPRHSHRQQHRISRPKTPEGAFLHASFYDDPGTRQRVHDAMDALIDRVTAKAGW